MGEVKIIILEKAAVGRKAKKTAAGGGKRADHNIIMIAEGLAQVPLDSFDPQTVPPFIYHSGKRITETDGVEETQFDLSFNRVQELAQTMGLGNVYVYHVPDHGVLHAIIRDERDKVAGMEEAKSIATKIALDEDRKLHLSLFPAGMPHADARCRADVVFDLHDQEIRRMLGRVASGRMDFQCYLISEDLQLVYRHGMFRDPLSRNRLKAVLSQFA